MGTRGLIGFVADGELKATYNHFDSYPDGLGEVALGFVAQLVKDGPAAVASAKARVKELAVVEEDAEPTAEQVAKLSTWTDETVNSPSETGKPSWYQLLRRTQGNPDAILSSGFLIDSVSFGNDSLFCEWGYVIDFDHEVIEVYRGFQRQQPTKGRWCSAEPDRERVARQVASFGYSFFPIEQVCTFSFAELPEPEVFRKRVAESAGLSDD